MTNGGTETDKADAWSATAWGDAGKRPTGVYGGFQADFTSAAAGGVCAIRKQ